MAFFSFLRKRKFYLHLLLGIVLALLLLFIVLKSLDIFTRHGEVYLVPDFTNKTLEGLLADDYGTYFTFSVIDSVYDANRNPGQIVLQNPLSGAKVKQGRHVYLTVVAQLPEKVIMPDLKNLSLRQALVTLEAARLQVASLDYIQYFARNAVVDQLLGEEPVEPETELVAGTPITLVLGKGEQVSRVPMPMLIGLSPREAESQLHYHSLNVGREFYQETPDPLHSRVYKTDPEVLTEELLSLGEKVNLWYRSDLFFDFNEYLKRFQMDSLRNDTIIITDYLISDED